jgi:toxin ParE1/3/4
MKSFDLTRKAKADLREIALYTEARWGVEQRNRYVRELDTAFHRLAASPLTGRSCDDILPGYRKYPQGSHVIFYRAGTECVIEIVRILHKSMDVEARLEV